MVPRPPQNRCPLYRNQNPNQVHQGGYAVDVLFAATVSADAADAAITHTGFF